MSKNSLFTSIPWLFISNISTLFAKSLFFPNLKIEPFVILRSIYIHKSLSNLLFVDAGPRALYISFLLDLFNTRFVCFFSKLWTPWCLTTLFKVQFVINKSVIISKNFLIMNSKYINIYNNLVKLTTNKDLYKSFKNQDTFSDRLIFFLLHFAFFLKVYKENNDKKLLQEIYDYIFRQVELSIREIGYGDQSINKKMKDYLNLFYAMIDKIDDWEDLNLDTRVKLLEIFLDNAKNSDYLVDYFEKYRLNLINNTLNSYIKGVVNT